MDAQALEKDPRGSPDLHVPSVSLRGLVGHYRSRARADPDALGGGPKHVTGTDSDFGDVDVKRGAAGFFAGSVTVKNPTNTFQDVIVTVDLFDGDQNVGELFGTVTVKLGTASFVELMPVDFYAPWGDAHVDLIRSQG